GQAGLAQADDGDGAERDQRTDVRQRPAQLRVADQLLPVGPGPEPQRHVDDGEGDRARHADDAAHLVAVLPAVGERVDEEEEPDAREQRPQPAHRPFSGDPCLLVGGPRGHSENASAGHTRAVSLLIRHAAPRTKIVSQPTALTTAYNGSSPVSGARVISATP